MKLRINQGSKAKPYWIAYNITKAGQLKAMLDRYGSLPHEFVVESADDHLMLYDLGLLSEVVA